MALHKLKETQHHPLTVWRFKYGQRLSHLAKALHSTAAYLSEIECGKKQPSMNFAIRLCEYTGLKLEDFIVEKVDAEGEPRRGGAARGKRRSSAAVGAG